MLLLLVYLPLFWSAYVKADFNFFLDMLLSVLALTAEESRFLSELPEALWDECGPWDFLKETPSTDIF